jgi:ligand-binding sensor domain-containing protein
MASRDGTLWISGLDVLFALRKDGLSSIRKREGLPGTTITTVFEDHDSRLWVGIDRTLYIYANGRFTPVNGRDGRPLGLIVGMAEDVDQNIWAEVSGTPRTFLRIRDGVVQEEFPAPQLPAARKIATDPGGGIWLGLMTGDLARYRAGQLETFHVEHRNDTFVRQLAVNPDGSVVAAAEFGLIGLRNGRTRTLTVQNGLPCDSVNAFVEDSRGALWLYMECALVRITRMELDRWWADPRVVLRTTVLDSADGVRPGLAPFQGAARTPDGRLWFANNLTLQMIDPNQPEDNAPSPAVTVERVAANRTSYSPENGLRIP